jgi:hypothetical protein
MIALLAHHVELQHVPVLMAIFAAGVFVGDRLLKKVTGQKK